VRIVQWPLKGHEKLCKKKGGSKRELFKNNFIARGRLIEREQVCRERERA
jgi:hypothetical protein